MMKFTSAEIQILLNALKAMKAQFHTPKGKVLSLLNPILAKEAERKITNLIDKIKCHAYREDLL